MNDIEFKEYLDQKLEEMPKDFLKRSVELLRRNLTNDDVLQIKAAYAEKGVHWIGMEHHMWGMAVRNFLRENGFADDQLPDGNWDDYYLQVIELACDIRQMEGI